MKEKTEKELKKIEDQFVKRGQRILLDVVWRPNVQEKLKHLIDSSDSISEDLNFLISEIFKDLARPEHLESFHKIINGEDMMWPGWEE